MNTIINRIEITDDELAKINNFTRNELSVDEISKMVGYNYSGNFVKMFKKIHGKTPLAFRKGKN